MLKFKVKSCNSTIIIGALSRNNMRVLPHCFYQIPAQSDVNLRSSHPETKVNAGRMDRSQCHNMICPHFQMGV